MSSILALEGLSKSWFGIPAVSNLTFDVRENAILGLIGQNGAGKSTLMNMIGGVVTPTSGKMTWRGQPYAPQSAADAKKAGIAFIHQELNLFTNLTVAENLFIDAFPRRRGLIDWARMKERSTEVLKRLALDIEPTLTVGRLSPGERQIVEIAKALHNEASLIIFDEPTTSLTPREASKLFDVIATLKSTGCSIVYISHTLGDVQKLADDIAVLRDGQLVDQGSAKDFPISRMIRSMIGRELGGFFPPRSQRPENVGPILTAKKISQPGVVKDISLNVHGGEIVGLFGLMGAGRSELARILFGLDVHAEGEITVSSTSLAPGPQARIAAGMAFVSENRRDEGLMLEAPIADNLALVTLSQFSKAPFSLLDFQKLRNRTENVKNELAIQARDIHTQPVKTLSGGNQQKVVIGKWHLAKPRLFILDEPTRGVDVGAKYEIYSQIQRMVGEGSGILLISSELEELIGMADRIVVMNRGEMMGEITSANFDRENILALAFQESAA